MIDPVECKWRVGRRNPRVIYAQLGTEPSDDDFMIGAMDDAEIAHEVVESHNARLAAAA